MKKYTSTSFIEKCKKIHNDKYDYSNVYYINNDIKIVVICKKHGEYLITPKNHIAGQGCKKCAYLDRDNRRSNTDVFIQNANIIHNNKYDYSLVKYTKAKDFVSIKCPTHGIFNIRANNHLSGQGCRQCGYQFSNYKKEQWIKKAKNRNGIFYIIKCWNDDEIFYKFGITFRSIKQRFSGKLLPYQYEIVREIKTSNLEYIWKLEKRFEQFVKNKKYYPKKIFSGSMRECYKIN